MFKVYMSYVLSYILLILTLSWRGPLSYRNQYIDLQSNFFEYPWWFLKPKQQDTRVNYNKD